MTETFFENAADAVAERRRREDGWRVEPRGDGFVLRPRTPEDDERDAAKLVFVCFNTQADLTISDWDDQDFRDLGHFVAEVAAEKRKFV